MEEKNLLHVNPLPGPTWNWLKVNDIKIEVPEDASEALAEVQLSGGISDSEMLEEADFTALSGAESGMEHPLPVGSRDARWILFPLLRRWVWKLQNLLWSVFLRLPGK